VDIPIYDALGRMVEQDRQSTYEQIVYAPRGAKLALMSSGQNLYRAFIPLTGGSCSTRRRLHHPGTGRQTFSSPLAHSLERPKRPVSSSVKTSCSCGDHRVEPPRKVVSLWLLFAGRRTWAGRVCSRNRVVKSGSEPL